MKRRISRNLGFVDSKGSEMKTRFDPTRRFLCFLFGKFQYLPIAISDEELEPR
jgi:hypothetical protein